MRKWVKILLAIVLIPVLLISVFAVGYVFYNQQGVIDPFYAGNPSSPDRILIASQGSEFKTKLVETLVKQFVNQGHFVSIVDCTSLGTENNKEWDVIIIIHTMQMHKMPESVKDFLTEVKDLSNIMLVSTSGAGDDKVDDFHVDAISSASRTTSIPEITKWVNTKLKEKLRNKLLSFENRY